MSIDSKRQINWINNLKGLMIILVIIGHTQPPTTVMNFIYGFHMPFFFILSGYLYNPSKWQEAGFKKLVVNKFKAYMIPYFGWAFFNLLINIPKDIFDYGKEAILSKTISRIGWIFYSWGSMSKMPNCTPLWFLPAIFLSILFLYLIFKVNNIIKVIIFVSAIALNAFCDYYDVPQLPWHIVVALLGTFFMYIGYSIKSKKLLEKKIPAVVLILLFILSTTLSLMNGFIDMNNSVFNNIILMLAGSIISSFVVLYIGQKFNNDNKFLGLFGKETILIMALNYAVVIYLRLIWEHIPLLDGINHIWLSDSLISIAVFYLLIKVWQQIRPLLPQFK